MRWDEPAHCHGAVVSRYVLQAAPAGCDDWVDVYAGAEAGARVASLQPACRYALRVAAVNSAGQGPFGEAEGAMTLPLPPAPPVSLALLGEPELLGPSSGGADAGGAAAALTWQDAAADATHAATMAYEVSAVAKPQPGAAVHADAAAQRHTLTCRGPPARLEGLAPGAMYGVRVRAVGVEGTGHSAWSEELLVATPAPPVPPADAAAELTLTPAATGKRGGGGGGKRAARRQATAAAGASCSGGERSADEVPAGALVPAAAARSAGVAAGPGALLLLPPAAHGGARQRGKAPGAASRVAAATAVPAAKVPRPKEHALKRLFEAGVERCRAQFLMELVFGPQWRRTYARSVRTAAYAVIITVVVAVVIPFLVTIARAPATEGRK